MKTILTLLMLWTVAAGIPFAQKPIIITEDSVSYANRYHPGVTVKIPEVPLEVLQKAWVKEMESGTKSKAVHENGEWSIFGAIKKSISPTPVNIYSKLAMVDSSVNLMVSMELKKDLYIESSSPAGELEKMKSFLKKFAKDQYLALAQDQLRAEENKQRDLEKDLSSARKGESRFDKSIRSDEKEIKDQQDNLSELNTELNTLTSELETQNTQYKDLPEGPAKEEKSKFINDLEKRKKKLRKEISSAENKIEKANSGIRNANSGIPEKQTQQNQIKEKLNKQKQVVRVFENKVNTIKSY